MCAGSSVVGDGYGGRFVGRGTRRKRKSEGGVLLWLDGERSRGRSNGEIGAVGAGQTAVGDQQGSIGLGGYGETRGCRGEGEVGGIAAQQFHIQYRKRSAMRIINRHC